MMTAEIQKEKYNTSPQSEEELVELFRDFGGTLKTASLSPQAYISCIFPIFRRKQRVDEKNRWKFLMATGVSLKEAALPNEQ
jgi:hypothetical protein